MDDLLKDAIADAKAVRETALENAKIALEEAFTPRLQSMLAKKIQAEIEDEDEMGDEEEAPEEGEYYEDDEDPSDEFSDEVPAEEEPIVTQDEIPGDEEMGDDEEELDMEGVIEINGVKYAPVVSEEEHEMEDEPEMEESDDLDLDEILKELEDDEDDEDEEPVDESAELPDDEEAAVDPVKTESNDVSSGIGGAENKQPANNANDDATEDSEGKGSSKAQGHENSDDKIVKEEEEVEEDIDLEEIVKALSEEEDEVDEANKVSKLQSELDEHRNVVKYLRSKLNEVNLLNAKLLFTNKLFRSYGLSNEQKMKVVENFDRAHNLREVKLVYSTLAESFGSNNNKTEIKENKKGSASKAVASTKSEKQEVIAEGHEMRDRFKKLAGIL